MWYLLFLYLLRILRPCLIHCLFSYLDVSAAGSQILWLLWKAPLLTVWGPHALTPCSWWSHCTPCGCCCWSPPDTTPGSPCCPSLNYCSFLWAEPLSVWVLYTVNSPSRTTVIPHCGTSSMFSNSILTAFEYHTKNLLSMPTQIVAELVEVFSVYHQNPHSLGPNTSPPH